MRILISNDDGYQAPGLRVLAATLGEIAKVTVVAPDRDRSGASNSLTLDNPIRANRIDQDLIAVDGTPTDCVHLAITGLLDEEPDMVVAGINAGSNLGDDVLYSGTVAAAVEGRFLGYPAIAVSLAGRDVSHFDTAARVAKLLMLRLLEHPLPSDTILNVNVPDVPLNKIMGFATTRLGHRHKSEPVIKMQDPRGRDIYWVGPPGGEQDAGSGTDFHAVRNNQVSITPMHIDLTRHSAIEEISGWIDGAVFE